MLIPQNKEIRKIWGSVWCRVESYDNKNSLSGIINVFQNLTDVENTHHIHERVFCWYKTGFLFLGNISGKDFGTGNNLDIYKLNKRDLCKLNRQIDIFKIMESLEE